MFGEPFRPLTHLVLGSHAHWRILRSNWVAKASRIHQPTAPSILSTTHNNLSTGSHPFRRVLTGDSPGVGITTYRQGGFIHLKTGLMDTSIHKNTPENTVSGGSGRIVIVKTGVLWGDWGVIEIGVDQGGSDGRTCLPNLHHLWDAACSSVSLQRGCQLVGRLARREMD